MNTRFFKKKKKIIENFSSVVDLIDTRLQKEVEERIAETPFSNLQGKLNFSIALRGRFYKSISSTVETQSGLDG